MSTANIASDLEEISEEVHDLDYGSGSGHLFSTLRRMVDVMTDMNEEIASLRKDLNGKEEKA